MPSTTNVLGRAASVSWLVLYKLESVLSLEYLMGLTPHARLFYYQRTINHEPINSRASSVSTQTELQATQVANVTSQKGTPTWEIAQLFPHQGDWTESEYLALDTNHLIELADGCLEFLPMPSPLHQLLMLFVLDELRRFVAKQKLGMVLPAPLPIRLWPGQFREPDVAYFRPERLTDLNRQPDGADLVVEVVSPGEKARTRDLEIKREEYARAGIREYWIIDPETQTVSVLALEGKSYRVHGEFKHGQVAESVLLPGFNIDVSALFFTGQTGGEKTP